MKRKTRPLSFNRMLCIIVGSLIAMALIHLLFSFIYRRSSAPVNIQKYYHSFSQTGSNSGTGQNIDVIYHRCKWPGYVYIPNSYITTSDVLWSSNYGSTVYERGAMVVSMLRTLAGDIKFYEACRNYLNDPSLAYKSATTADLQAHFAGLVLNNSFNGKTDKYLLNGMDTLPNYPVTDNNATIRISCRLSNILNGVVYYNRAVATATAYNNVVAIMLVNLR